MDYSKREHNNKVTDEDYYNTHSNTHCTLIPPRIHNSSGGQSIGELSSGGLYFRRGLTFFINHFQQKQYEIKSRPVLSVVYDPRVSPDTYNPEESIHFRLLDVQRTEYVVERKCLKIAIENQGGGVAEKCKATLRLLTYNPSGTRHPSGEPKSLLWDTDQVTQDIGINDNAILYVILSESRNRVLSRQENYHALVATPQMVKVKDSPYSIRAQDAMGVGDFYVEIVIIPKSGDFVKCVFCVHVRDDWHQLSMERIS